MLSVKFTPSQFMSMHRQIACLLAISFASKLDAQCSPATQRLLAEGKADEARTQMAAIVARAPNDHEAVECLGRVLMDLDRPKEASGHFERAIKIADNVSSHHLWLANALGSLADSTSKIKLPFLARRVKSEFERAVELDPRSIEGRDGLIKFYSQAPGVMGGSMDKAWEQVREIARINSMRGHFAAANLHGREKKTAEVEKELLAAEKQSPDSALAGYTLGNFYINQQRWADAFALYDRMSKQFPSEPNVHFQIGRISALSGQQLDRGEKELKWWFANQPKDALTGTRSNGRYRLGLIYEKQGKKDLARAEYEQALALNPGHAEAKKALGGLK